MESKTLIAPVKPYKFPIPGADKFQYRAIGLIRGTIVLDTQNWRGKIITADRKQIRCVVLPKARYPIKLLPPNGKYLWVVYPRTHKHTGAIQLQVVGVWAPMELKKASKPIDPKFPEDTFSVRGEIIYIASDRAVVKIRRSDVQARTNPLLRKFKLQIFGNFPADAKGFFFDLQVKRRGTKLYLVNGKKIGKVPQKKQFKVPTKHEHKTKKGC